MRCIKAIIPDSAPVDVDCGVFPATEYYGAEDTIIRVRKRAYNNQTRIETLKTFPLKVDQLISYDIRRRQNW